MGRIHAQERPGRPRIPSRFRPAVLRRGPRQPSDAWFLAAQGRSIPVRMPGRLRAGLGGCQGLRGTVGPPEHPPRQPVRPARPVVQRTAPATHEADVEAKWRRRASRFGSNAPNKKSAAFQLFTCQFHTPSPERSPRSKPRSLASVHARTEAGSKTASVEREEGSCFVC